ncbi:MAG: DUF308 domain-containing protein [Lachnospiraceae bacterium]|nr:DUF308 domain-containing protein [Lachnospiraceae bacterium]
MKKILNNTSMVTDVILLILGVIMLCRPWDVMSNIVRVIGILLVIVGAVVIITAVMGGKIDSSKLPTIIGGVGTVVAGIIFWSRPWIVVNAVEKVFGIIIVLHGVMNLSKALRVGKQEKIPVELILSVVSIVLGVLVFFGIFGATQVVKIIGAVLIFNSCLSIWTSLKNSL